MNREIFKIALPAIVANITIPLLGLLDTAIAGHLGAAAYLGAISVGAMMFNLIYWNFGFLRMGTSGITAQAYGKGDRAGQARILQQATLLGLVISFGILLLQVPLQQLTLWLIGPSDEVRRLAKQYYYICIWGAPPLMMMMSIKGWLLGMQDSYHAMAVSIVVNMLNIVLSLIAVYGLHMGFVGIAVGTAASGWVGLLYSLWVLGRHYGWLKGHFSWHEATSRKDARRFFNVNGDIFVRSALMMVVMLFFIAIGARSGDLLLAVNALIMQMFTLYSYFLDGIAFAGEAIVGKYYGSGNSDRVSLAVRRLFAWGILFTAMFTVAYAFPHGIFALLTSNTGVINAAMDYRLWCALIPIAGMAAFVWDGIYIGLTRTRGMLLAVFVAFALFFVVFWLTPAAWGNNRLWLAYIIFLFTRGVVQSAIYRLRIRKDVRRIASRGGQQ